jgi:hypothetical protein
MQFQLGERIMRTVKGEGLASPGAGDDLERLFAPDAGVVGIDIMAFGFMGR